MRRMLLVLAVALVMAAMAASSATAAQPAFGWIPIAPGPPGGATAFFQTQAECDAYVEEHPDLIGCRPAPRAEVNASA